MDVDGSEVIGQVLGEGADEAVLAWIETGGSVGGEGPIDESGCGSRCGCG